MSFVLAIFIAIVTAFTLAFSSAKDFSAKRQACDAKGGIYLQREDLCVKKDAFL